MGVKILAVKVLGRSVKQNGRDPTYTPGTSRQKTCVKAAPLPLPPLVPSSFLPLSPPCCTCHPSLLEKENKACSLWDQGPGQTCGLYTHTSLSQSDGSLPLTSITVDKHYLFNKDAKNFQSLTHREEEFGKTGRGMGKWGMNGNETQRKQG